jgi:hypothetical protein
VAALERLSPLVAHGGVAGAVVEGGLALTILVLFLAVWLRERKHRSRADDEG